MFQNDNQLNEFTLMHDNYILDWNRAMMSGDVSSLERMSEEYYVAFFKGLNKKPTIFSKEEALSGMQQSIMQLLGAKKKFKNRVIRLKDVNNVVVFYEQLIEKDEKVLARLFTIENWQLSNGKWMLIREIEESIN